MLIVDNPTATFPKTKEGEQVIIKYRLKNNFKEDIKIKLPIATSCGCSLPYIGNNQLKPHQATDVLVLFDTLGKKGVQEKSIYIEYDINGKFERFACKFTGEVI